MKVVYFNAFVTGNAIYSSPAAPSRETLFLIQNTRRHKMTEENNNLFIIFVYKLMHFIPAFKTYAPTQCNLFLILI